MHFPAPFCNEKSLIINFLIDYQALSRGVGRDRTADTRIFSPLLYRLSYRTIPETHRLSKWKPSLAFVLRGGKYRGNSQEIHKKI